MALAGLFSALRITGGNLTEQTILFLGAGEAATGIADLTASAMVAEGASEADARGRIWLVDSKGLVVKDRAALNAEKMRYAHPHAHVADFLSAIKALKPTAIIGVAAVGGTFTPEVLRTMAADQQAADHLRAVQPDLEGRMLGRRGLPAHRRTRAVRLRQPLRSGDASNGKTFVPRQGNNSYIFPGVGLGAIASGTQLVTDEMFMAAARTLAEMVSETDLKQGSLYPALPQIREVSARIAAAVAAVAYQRGLASGPAPNDLAALVQSQMYDPRY